MNKLEYIEPLEKWSEAETEINMNNINDDIQIKYIITNISYDCPDNLVADISEIDIESFEDIGAALNHYIIEKTGASPFDFDYKELREYKEVDQYE